MENNIIRSLFSGDFKSFKEGITSALYSKITNRMEEAKKDVAGSIFGESKEDKKYKEDINHADKDGYKEDMESAKEEDDEDEEPHGGEFLVDLKFTDGNETELKNFRVAAVSKEDVESRLNGFFGKGKFEVQNIKVNEEVEQIDETKLNPEEGKWHVLDDNTGKIVSTHSGYKGASAKMKKLSFSASEKGDNSKYTAVSAKKYNKDNNIVGDHIEEQRFEKGEDVGKPGMGFKKVAAKAAKEYGSEEAGKRVAGAVLKKILKKK